MVTSSRDVPSDRTVALTLACTRTPYVGSSVAHKSMPRTQYVQYVDQLRIYHTYVCIHILFVPDHIPSHVPSHSCSMPPPKPHSIRYRTVRMYCIPQSTSPRPRPPSHILQATSHTPQATFHRLSPSTVITVALVPLLGPGRIVLQLQSRSPPSAPVTGIHTVDAVQLPCYTLSVN